MQLQILKQALPQGETLRTPEIASFAAGRSCRRIEGFEKGRAESSASLRMRAFIQLEAEFRMQMTAHCDALVKRVQHMQASWQVLGCRTCHVILQQGLPNCGHLCRGASLNAMAALEPSRGLNISSIRWSSFCSYCDLPTSSLDRYVPIH